LYNHSYNRPPETGMRHASPETNQKTT